MGDFSAAWLQLREPADHRCAFGRAHDRACSKRSRVDGLRILDLACGTGSNLRYLRGRSAFEPDAGRRIKT